MATATKAISCQSRAARWPGVLSGRQESLSPLPSLIPLPAFLRGNQRIVTRGVAWSRAGRGGYPLHGG